MNALAQEFQAYLGKSIFKVLGAPIAELERRHGESYSRDFEQHLELLRVAFPEKPWPKWVVDGFIRFNKEILREEQGFRESGQYSAGPEDFTRIVDETYDNAEVMDRYYLVGLYCSYFVWPHHYEILSFFRESFLNSPDAEPETLSEWGVGHGLFSMMALRRWPKARAVLADVSRHSLNFSEAILGVAGCMERCTSRLGDVTKTGEDPPVNRIICGELLEHVPEPAALMEQIRRSLQPKGVAYLTAAVNAPQSDHISLFRSEGEVLDLVEKQGFSVRQHISVCHPNRSEETNPPLVVAMVVERAG